MTRFYIYKMTVNNGGAPCVKDGLLSLAICKPAIRRTAKKGDVVFGFAANSLFPDNRLVYVAEISEAPMKGKRYYSEMYSQRADCIYEWEDPKFVRRSGAKFHAEPNDLEHDLGSASNGYRKARVLLSHKFRYFGCDIAIEYKTKEFTRLTHLIESLGRGHRVNIKAKIRKELSRLKDKAWEVSSKESTPVPSAPCLGNCRDDSEGSGGC